MLAGNAIGTAFGIFAQLFQLGRIPLVRVLSFKKIKNFSAIGIQFIAGVDHRHGTILFYQRESRRHSRRTGTDDDIHEVHSARRPWKRRKSPG